MLDFEGLRTGRDYMSACTGRETLSSAMACEPTTDLDDQGAAGDRVVAPADGGRGMDSLASGANQPTALSADEIERIVRSRHDKPYRVLGPQPARGGQWTTVRAFMPHARRVVLRLLGERSAKYEMHRAHPEGLYQTQIPQPADSIDYEYLVQEEGRAPCRCSDPYRFRGIRFSGEDQRLFVRGEHLRLFEKLGARPATRGRVPGVEFAVWAPHAKRVSVVGAFDAWDGRRSDAAGGDVRRLGAVRSRRRAGRSLQVRDQDPRRLPFP